MSVPGTWAQRSWSRACSSPAHTRSILSSVSCVPVSQCQRDGDCSPGALQPTRPVLCQNLGMPTEEAFWDAKSPRAARDLGDKSTGGLPRAEPTAGSQLGPGPLEQDRAGQGLPRAHQQCCSPQTVSPQTLLPCSRVPEPPCCGRDSGCFVLTPAAFHWPRSPHGSATSRYHCL